MSVRHAATRSIRCRQLPCLFELGSQALGLAPTNLGEPVIHLTRKDVARA